MFNTLYRCPRTIARHENGPSHESRRRYLIISGGELRGCPGLWKITGRMEGESDSWSIVRKPDGTYWEVAGTHIFSPTGGMLRIDTGDQILDAKKLARCEEYYDQLQQKLAESEGKGSQLP